jgi:hypothetical protein
MQTLALEPDNNWARATRDQSWRHALPWHICPHCDTEASRTRLGDRWCCSACGKSDKVIVPW